MLTLIDSVISLVVNFFTMIKSQTNPLVIVLFAFILVDNILGLIPSIKANSIYEVVSSLLTTLKNEVLPSNTPASAVSPKPPTTPPTA